MIAWPQEAKDSDGRIIIKEWWQEKNDQSKNIYQ